MNGAFPLSLSAEICLIVALLCSGTGSFTAVSAASHPTMRPSQGLADT